MNTNDKAIWNEIYEKENFNPGWATPGTDPNLVKILSERFQNRAAGDDVRLLDIGCGNGRNSMVVEALPQIPLRYTGVDFADKAVDHCRKTYSTAKSFAVLDLTVEGADLGKPFDAVIDCGCFHAIPPEHRPVYRANLKALTKPDAVIIVAGWYRSDDVAFSDQPSCYPYLYLNEWCFQPADLDQIFAPDFVVETHQIDDEIYRKVDERFGYFTLRKV